VADAYNIVQDGNTIKGGIMRIPAGSALPVATVQYRDIIAIVEALPGAADSKYVCMKNSANAYRWVKIFDGNSDTIIHQAVGL